MPLNSHRAITDAERDRDTTTGFSYVKRRPSGKKTIHAKDNTPQNQTTCNWTRNRRTNRTNITKQPNPSARIPPLGFSAILFADQRVTLPVSVLVSVALPDRTCQIFMFSSPLKSEPVSEHAFQSVKERSEMNLRAWPIDK